MSGFYTGVYRILYQLNGPDNLMILGILEDLSASQSAADLILNFLL